MQIPPQRAFQTTFKVQQFYSPFHLIFLHSWQTPGNMLAAEMFKIPPQTQLPP